nr:hypothetical protein [Pelagerythrobacter aerophilus]
MDLGEFLAGQHLSSLAQPDTMQRPNEIENVAAGTAPETLEALAVVEDRKRGRAIVMQRTAGLPLPPGTLELHDSPHDFRQGVRLLDRFKVDHAAPPRDRLAKYALQSQNPFASRRVTWPPSAMRWRSCHSASLQNGARASSVFASCR